VPTVEWARARRARRQRSSCGGGGWGGGSEEGEEEGGAPGPAAASAAAAAVLVERRQRRHVHGLAQAKVGQLDVPPRVQQQVVRLDVAVHEPRRVHGLDRRHGLRRVKARLGLGQHVAAHQQRHEVAARQVLHGEVEVRVVLERVVEAHDEGEAAAAAAAFGRGARVVAGGGRRRRRRRGRRRRRPGGAAPADRRRVREHVALGPHVRRLPAPHHVRLAQALERHHLARRALAHDAHLAKRAAADQRERLKVGRRQPLALQAREGGLAALEVGERGAALGVGEVVAAARELGLDGGAAVWLFVGCLVGGLVGWWVGVVFFFFSEGGGSSAR
jgi:hypothetical protein